MPLLVRTTSILAAGAIVATGGITWSGGVASASPALGTWTELTAGLPEPMGNTPSVVQRPDGRGYVLWYSHGKGSQQKSTYYFATVTPSGALAGPPESIFGTDYWGGLNYQPTLVLGDESDPIVIFEGIRSLNKGDGYGSGCVVSAQGPNVPWALSKFSLTNPCGSVGPGGAAEMSGEDEFSAEQGGGSQINYMLRQEPGVPPSPKLAHSSSVKLPCPCGVGRSAEIADLAGNGDAYVAWAQENVPGQYGLYAKNLSTNGPIMKAPGSGLRSANVFPPAFGNLAFTSTNTHSGVFLAYCSNTQNCNVLLWRVGTAGAMATPAAGISGNADMAISPGPEGRLWLAWWQVDKAGNLFISVARTNKDDSRFGPGTTYPTSCWSYPPLIGLGGGSWGRVDIAVQCTVSKPKIATKDFVTQAMVPLALHPTTSSFDNSKGHRLTFTVTDVGDPVPGAAVSIVGKGLNAVTGASGSATITVPAKFTPGDYSVVATAPNYLPGHASVAVTLPAVPTGSAVARGSRTVRSTNIAAP
ncbi:MAG TPA: carboxypeptidase-like regulatory domain-containing protein [Acidimicrobiales bacterium]|nr:carboxypeptidase-like regulatory domain-containing protein [Acidimicrobiales bacterium]